MTLHGVILAAGASRRMGFPKALLEWQGETYVGRLAREFSLHCARVTIVVREDHSWLGERLSAAVAVNPEPERGQLSSLQIGLRQAPADFEAALFTPVDYGHVKTLTIAELVRRAEHGAPVTMPRHAGRHGHPVVIRAEVMAALLALDPTADARQVIRGYTTAYADVDDPGILIDADAPEVYRRLREDSR